MEKRFNEEAAGRIARMEAYFDALNHAVNTAPETVKSDEDLRGMLEILTEYYEGGLWLQDYTLDEQGLIPEDIKRGVLSQDGLFELMENISGL